MGQLHSQFARVRRATVLAIALAAVGHLPAAARADSVLPEGPLFIVDLTWAAALFPAPGSPGEALKPPPLAGFDDVPDQIFSLAVPSPGLQLSLDPDDEEFFLGWQFEF